jgi:dTDP-4-amino-4,6-dideoxygalactose transaminase
MMGNVGFYSFGRGKSLAAMEGALIITNSDDIAAAIREETQMLPSTSMIHSAWLLSQMLIYSVFLRPRLYWLPNKLPFLNLGATEFEPEFPEFRMPALIEKLLIRTHVRLQEFNAIRRRNAAALREGLKGNPFFAVPSPSPDCVPNYIRFPLVARDESTRDRAVQALQAAGIGATPFYPSALCDIEGIERHMATADFHRPCAEALSRRLFTLPTHPFVLEGDLHRMIAILNQT